MKGFITPVNVELEEKIERASIIELGKMQNKRLRWTIQHAFRNSPFYRKKFKENGIASDDIKRIEDLMKIPIATKDDFRTNAQEFLAVPSEELILSFATTGTTGAPCPTVFTLQDLDYSTRAVFRGMNIRSNDVVAQLYGYYAAVGHIRHIGAMRLGAKVLPMGASNTRYLPRAIVETMKQHQPTVLTGLSTDILRLADAAYEMKIDTKTDFHINKIQGGAEMCTKSRKRKIEELWDAKFFDNYGFAELSIPFSDCPKGKTHAWMDLYAIETVNPKTNEVIQPGEPGEICVTSLTREAMPLIRYCPGDIVTIHKDSCGCGRKHPVLTVKGRKRDRALVNNHEFWCSDVENVLMKYTEVGGEYQIEIRKKNGDDLVICRVEVNRRLTNVDERSLRELLGQDLNPLIKCPLEIEILKPDSLHIIWRATGFKAQRLLDLRSK